jgi:hypothetical protein
LSLDEAETFLRVEHSDDDQVIAALIAGARMYVETQAQIALITQSAWRSIAGRGLVVLPTPITEIDRRPRNIRFVPQADIHSARLAFVIAGVDGNFGFKTGLTSNMTD